MEGDVFLHCHAIKFLHSAIEQFPDGDALFNGIKTLGFNRRNVNQFLHQLTEVLALVADDGEKFPLGINIRYFTFENELDEG